MSLYLRRLVSGNKARYKDDQLNLELDLVYVTDNIIVMGFPAVGVESIYRNHRADVQRFLSARHGSDFWVFNFCPHRENAYHESVFGGRVSRYPFPDHHVPPFFYFPLVTREMHAWLSGSNTRVAVLHCKAGKGRSGTLACAYLLSPYASFPVPIPTLDDSFSDWSLIGIRDGLQTPSEDSSTVPSDSPPLGSLARVSSEPSLNTLEKVLNLHTSRRMKPDSDIAKKRKMGVSIPSQQRWLFYWTQVLAEKGPPSLCFIDRDQETTADNTPKISQVKVTKLTVRMGEPSRIQPHLVQAARVVITGAGKGRAASESTSGRLWASLARYNDELVDELEHWEKESASRIESSPFRDDRWDRAKMITSFARMGTSDILPTLESGSRRPTVTYVLRPLHEAQGDQIKSRERVPGSNPDGSREFDISSENASYDLVSPTEDTDDAPGILVDGNRELRIRLFLGEVVLGWVWLIPAFHISPDSSSCNLVLSNDDIDFAIGIGKALVDITVSFSCTPD